MAVFSSLEFNDLELVDPQFRSWNQTLSWLRRIETLREDDV